MVSTFHHVTLLHDIVAILAMSRKLVVCGDVSCCCQALSSFVSCVVVNCCRQLLLSINVVNCCQLSIVVVKCYQVLLTTCCQVLLFN